MCAVLLPSEYWIFNRLTLIEPGLRRRFLA